MSTEEPVLAYIEELALATQIGSITGIGRKSHEQALPKQFQVRDDRGWKYRATLDLGGAA